MGASDRLAGGYCVLSDAMEPVYTRIMAGPRQGAGLSIAQLRQEIYERHTEPARVRRSLD
jgi:hypothetical protein